MAVENKIYAFIDLKISLCLFLTMNIHQFLSNQIAFDGRKHFGIEITVKEKSG